MVNRRFVLKRNTALLTSCTAFACPKDSIISRIHRYHQTAISAPSPRDNGAYGTNQG